VEWVDFRQSGGLWYIAKAILALGTHVDTNNYNVSTKQFMQMGKHTESVEVRTLSLSQTLPHQIRSLDLMIHLHLSWTTACRQIPHNQ
jgi:hypothetical protein